MKLRHDLPLSVGGCIGTALELAPVLALLTALFRRPVGDNLPRLLCLTAVGLAGYFFSRLLRKRTSFPPILQWACLLASGGLLGAGSGLLLGTGPLEQGFLAAFFLFAHVWCASVAGRPFGALLTTRTLARTAGLYGACIPVVWAINKLYPIAYSHLLNAVCFLIIAAFAALIWNQSAIDDLTASRHYSLESLPRRIRPYNLGLVILVIGLTALLFWGLLMLTSHVDALMGMVREWLLDLLRGLSFTPEDVPPTIVEEAPMDTPMLPPDAGEGLSLPWLGALIKWGMTLLCIVGVSAVVFLNRVQILDWFRQLWLSLSGAAARLFRRPDREQSDSEYTDASQSLLMEDRPAATLRQDRKWRKDLRAYGRMADSPEKYRQGYRLLLEGLRLWDVPVRPSDTPREASHKAEPLLSVEDLRSGTDGYQLLRYADQPDQPEGLRALSRLLSQLRKRR